MGLVHRHRIRLGRNLRLNLSGSGVSVSVRAGRLTYTSRRGVSIRLATGLSYRAR